MPIFFLLLGILFIVASVRGKSSITELTTLIKSDFTGPNNFIVWSLAVGSVAALSYVPDPEVKKFSTYFLALIFISIILGRRNVNTGEDFFTSFFNQLRSTEGSKNV